MVGAARIQTWLRDVLKWSRGELREGRQQLIGSGRRKVRGIDLTVKESVARALRHLAICCNL